MVHRTLEKLFDNIHRITINPGSEVICDICSKDYTTLDDKGGFLFSNWGVCPECAPGFRKEAIEFGEGQYIKHECPPEMSFREFIYAVREMGY